MSLKGHIILGTLLGVLLGVGAVTVLSHTGSPAASSAEASESGGAGRAAQPSQPSQKDRPDDAVSPAALRGDVLTGDFSRPMRPGAQRRSLQS